MPETAPETGTLPSPKVTRFKSGHCPFSTRLAFPGGVTEMLRFRSGGDFSHFLDKDTMFSLTGFASVPLMKSSRALPPSHVLLTGRMPATEIILGATAEVSGALRRSLWASDLGDGTYKNPILHADYSDPNVIRHGDDFFMTASSFNCTPGLPILHSRDLINWTLINHAVGNLPHSRYEQVQPGCGVWAPAIRSHAGKFWIFFPMPDEGIYVTTANHPSEKWSEPHLLQGGKGLIDPCPLWDDDGRAYLVHAYAGSRAGIKHRLRVCPMAPDASSLLGEGQIVFHEPEKHPTL